MSSLRYITSSSASSVSSMSFTNCFTSDFDVYKISLTEIEFAAGDMFFRFIDSSGIPVTDSSYQDAVLLMRSYGSFADNYGQSLDMLGSIGYDDNQNGGGCTTLWVFNPNSTSLYTTAIWENTGQSSIGPPVRKGIGSLDSTAEITGITFIGNATIEKVAATVYGLRIET